jgi:anti-sigma B factor antagonist
MLLEIEASAQGGYTVVSPHGEIDLSTNHILKEAVGERLAAGEAHLVVDLSAPSFIDSTGLGALIGARRKAHDRHGSFAVVCAQATLLKLFRITGLDSVFEIHDTLEGALARPVTAYAGEADAGPTA